MRPLCAYHCVQLVVNFDSVRSGLPNTIEGFFFLVGSSDADQQKARRAHAAFLEEYSLSESDGPPLLLLDLGHGDRGGMAAFRLAQSTRT